MKKLNKIIILSAIICIIAIVLSDNNLENNIKTLINNTLATANTGDLAFLNSNGEIISDSEVSSLKDSGITGEDYNFDTTYYPYYSFLSSKEQRLYKQIYANIYKLSTTFVPIVTVESEELKVTIEAVYNDHPELFWLNTNYTYKYTKNGNCVQIIMSFNETIDNIETSKSLFETKANNIINEANKLSSNYAKEKYVHDTISKLVDYDKNASINQSAYSALVNGQTVCAGYARAFQYIMIKLKIPTYYCVGTAGGDHAWNIVKLSDGYYNVDLTWDDANNVSYKYFNLTDTDFSTTHTRTDSSVSLPSCTATTYSNLETTSSNVAKDVTTSTKNNNVTSNTDTKTNSTDTTNNNNSSKDNEVITNDNNKDNTTVTDNNNDINNYQDTTNQKVDNSEQEVESNNKTYNIYDIYRILEKNNE